MAGFRRYAWSVGGLLLLLAGGAGPTIELRESTRRDEGTRVVIELRAEGTYRPAGPDEGVKQKDSKEQKAEAPKPLALRVETRYAFVERALKVGTEGRAARVVRRVGQAASAINGEVRPSAAVLRPDVSLLVAEPRDEAVLVFSPGGPLTRSELELVQGVGDPLAFSGLLPRRPVAVGDRWKVGADAARALTSYDALAVNGLGAELESADASSAKVRLKGEVRGAVLGGEGTISCEGSFTFDRKAARIDHLTLERKEVRRPGPVEAGLDVKSTLTVERKGIAVPPELTDEALSGAALEPTDDRLLLFFNAPNGKYSLLHDRDWHLFWDDNRQTVLKRLDHGEVVAQCNLVMGPNAGKGRHQDLAQFRDDIRRALGKRFDSILGVGEVDGDAAGGFRYKVGVQGHEGQVGVLWNYFLVASPEGDQLLATFTLTDAQAKAFADQDLRLIGSLRWLADETGKP